MDGERNVMKALRPYPIEIRTSFESTPEKNAEAFLKAIHGDVLEAFKLAADAPEFDDQGRQLMTATKPNIVSYFLAKRWFGLGDTDEPTSRPR